MHIMITGSPGTGKTSAARALGKKLQYTVLNEKGFAIEKKIGKWDTEEDELIIPLKPFILEIKKELKKQKNLILEGHMLCELKLPVDFVILMRCHPELLEAKLEARGYSAEKVQDNVFCEGIDYCKKHLLRRYPEKKVIEVHVKRTIKETMGYILDRLEKAGAKL